MKWASNAEPRYLLNGIKFLLSMHTLRFVLFFLRSKFQGSHRGETKKALQVPLSCVGEVERRRLHPSSSMQSPRVHVHEKKDIFKAKVMQFWAVPKEVLCAYTQGVEFV